jgi:hypothetical protein
MLTTIITIHDFLATINQQPQLKKGNQLSPTISTHASSLA